MIWELLVFMYVLFYNMKLCCNIFVQQIVIQ